MLNLAEFGRIRIKADHLDVDSIDREGRLVVIKFRPNARLDGARLVRVVGGWPGAVLVPPVSVKLDLEAPLAAAKAPLVPKWHLREGRWQGTSCRVAGQLVDDAGDCRRGEARVHEGRGSA